MTWGFKLAAVAALVISYAGTGWYGYSSGKETGMAEVQQKWDEERALILAAQAEEQMKARQREQELQALTAKLRREKDAEVRRLTRQYAALADSVRNRPERPSDSDSELPADSGDSSGGAGCTGAELFQPDAAFLIREAERADQLRIALQQCQAAYESARKVTSQQ